MTFNFAAIVLIFISKFSDQTINSFISISVLVFITFILIAVEMRQKHILNILKTQNSDLAKSRDSSLEYIDALWKSQQGIIRDEKLTSLNSLVSGIAHELNTPLGVALTASSYLNDLLNSEEGKSLIDDAEPMLNLAMSNLLRSISLVEKFTEISGGNEQDESFPVLINEFLDFACCRVKSTKALEKIDDIKMDIPDNMWVDISQLSLSIVVKNILENAFDYAYKEDNDGRISIEVEDHDRDLIITITDNGVGIPDKDVKYIFDPFYTTRRAQQHYGLGLAISYNLLKRDHDGRINCVAGKSGGVEMTLTIPDAVCKAPKKKARA